MSENDKKESGLELTRRNFIKTTAAAGLGLMLDKVAMGQAAPGAAPAAGSKLNEIHVAIVGVGRQGGDNLMKCTMQIPGIRFVAACDIWETRRTFAQRYCKKYNQQINVYEDLNEMLAKEGKNIDAVIVATPDWMHSPHTVTCLKAGKHVYCEKEMSNTVEGAKAMVLAARESGKLLQIGHQRRSNPRYLHAIKMIEKDKVCGRITNFYGQWNRNVNAAQDVGWAKRDEIAPALLQKYGYESMQEFRNWRWFKKYSGGPIVDLGSHQIDVFSWILKANPKSVMASGGTDYYKSRQWYGDVLTVFEYDTPAGSARGFYQVLNTSGYNGYYEVFNGDAGSLVISEDPKKGQFFPEPEAKKKDWEALSQNKKKDASGNEVIDLKIGESLTGKQAAQSGQAIVAEVKDKPIHQFHLENFFDAVRINDKTKLTCPPDVAFESAVAVLKVNEAIAARKTLEFKPEDFKV